MPSCRRLLEAPSAARQRRGPARPGAGERERAAGAHAERRARQGASDPEKVFDRTANLENTQIINYRVDPAEKWCVLIGIAPGAAERCAPAAGRSHLGSRLS